MIPIRQYILEMTFQQVLSYSPHTSDFRKLLYDHYELAYKYQRVNEWIYQGYKGDFVNPIRSQNILKGYTDALKENTDVLVEKLIPIFKEWIDLHDGSNMETWMRMRFNSGRPWSTIDVEEVSDNMSWYLRDYFNMFNDTVIRSKSVLWNKLKKMPSLHRYIEVVKHEIDSTSDEEAIKYVINHQENLESLLSTIKAYDSNLAVKVLYELGSNIIYPLWYNKFNEEDKLARAIHNIKDAYKRISNLKNKSVDDSIVEITLAINAAHVSGPFHSHFAEYGVLVHDMEYLSGNIERMMTDDPLHHHHSYYRISGIWDRELLNNGVFLKLSSSEKRGLMPRNPPKQVGDK